MTDVSLIPLKEKAVRFPEPVRTLILSEPDMLDSQDFISKIGTWERLLKIQQEVKK